MYVALFFSVCVALEFGFVCRWLPPCTRGHVSTQLSYLVLILLRAFNGGWLYVNRPHNLCLRACITGKRPLIKLSNLPPI